ncbi:tRNA 2-thiouridine(34) synthase MnmA [Fontivita pretiosa]|uniref:tRNA 2-thiouridine(34) synthase MnmA n=1 Tax=Fontivita pretiosa TaxID=2989684 RepID=UPI003D1683F2
MSFGNDHKKVVVAMSGGVDSSVAAALLLRAGYEVVGVFMRLGWPNGVARDEAEGSASADISCDPSGKSRQGCCSVLDAADARRVAGALGIPFYVLNFEEDFDRVIDYFVAEYNRGRTPNPCVRCNDWLKFGKLARYAEAIGADYVASGHYARIGTDPLTGEKALLRGRDHRKDQSYVLFGMTRAAIEHTLLPIGEFEKQDVRAIARELDLPVHNKPDSQEICFVPNQDYAGLLRRRAPQAFSPGKVVDSSGKVVGEHEGHQHFTIGQRRGVGVALGYPLYVVDIDPHENRVIVGGREDLLRSKLVARQINILNSRLRDAAVCPEPSAAAHGPIRCQAKIRYNHAPQPATATLSGPDELTVHFDEPQSAITPGQAVVLYDGDVVLGGGWIERSER